MKYTVFVREIWQQGYNVEAANKLEAIERVLQMVKEGVAKSTDLNEDAFEYIENQDPSLWKVMERK